MREPTRKQIEASIPTVSSPCEEKRDTFNINDCAEQQNNVDSFYYEFNATEDLLVDMSVSIADMSAIKITAELADNDTERNRIASQRVVVTDSEDSDDQDATECNITSSDSSEETIVQPVAPDISSKVHKFNSKFERSAQKTKQSVERNSVELSERFKSKKLQQS